MEIEFGKVYKIKAESVFDADEVRRIDFNTEETVSGAFVDSVKVIYRSKSVVGNPLKISVISKKLLPYIFEQGGCDGR